jgi:predicted DNA-binding transcriptional regulator AlpA
MPLTPPAFFTSRQAADHLGLSKSHLDKLRTLDPDRSPPFLRIGAAVRYPVADLAQWAADRMEGGR